MHWLHRHARFTVIAKECFGFNISTRIKRKACAHIEQNITSLEAAEFLDQYIYTTHAYNTVPERLDSMCSTVIQF